MLYRLNTLCFTHEQTGDTARPPARLVAYTHSILPQHVGMIRHIRLDVHFSWDQNRGNDDYHLSQPQERHWKIVCSALRQMSRLASLRIRMFAHLHEHYVLWTGRQLSVKGRVPEQNILTILSGIQPKTEFMVEMPWTDEVVDELQGKYLDIELVGPKY